MRSKVLSWSICVVVSALAIIGIEAFLRFRGLGEPIVYYVNSSYRYAPVPNQSKSRFGDLKITIDSHGLRGAKDWQEQADVKILFIGDSITYGGSRIDDTETFAHLVGVRLQDRLGMTFTCGNAGVNGYGTDNMAARIRWKHFDDEDVIVVTLFVGNVTRGLADVRMHPFFVRKPSPPFKALWEAATYAMYFGARRLRLENRRLFDDKYQEVARRSLESLITELHRKEDQGKIVLVVLSAVERELNGRENARTVLTRDVLMASRLQVLDMYAVLKQTGAKDVFTDGYHLSVEGHRIYAQAIADRLAPLLGPSGSEATNRRTSVRAVVHE